MNYISIIDQDANIYNPSNSILNWSLCACIYIFIDSFFCYLGFMLLERNNVIIDPFLGEHLTSPLSRMYRRVSNEHMPILAEILIFGVLLPFLCLSIISTCSFMKYF